MTASDFLPRRLVQFVKEASVLSTAGVREAYEQGRIKVSSGQVVLPNLNDLVYQEDEISLDGQPLKLGHPRHYALLHKPEATLCVPHDLRDKGDLWPWLRQMPAGVFAVGRLDRDTTGALLFTDDGDLTNRLLRPEHHTDKIYLLSISKPIAREDSRLSALRQGIDVGPYFAKAKKVVWVGADEEGTQLELTLDEGRHRQIRRMCRAVRLPLKQLHRLSVGPVTLQGLALGKWRHLEALEVEALWQAVGGQQRLRDEKIEALRARAQRMRDEAQPDLRLQRWLENHC